MASSVVFILGLFGALGFGFLYSRAVPSRSAYGFLLVGAGIVAACAWILAVEASNAVVSAFLLSSVLGLMLLRILFKKSL